MLFTSKTNVAQIIASQNAKKKKRHLQTIFWHAFYTILSQKTSPRSPEPLKLPEDLKKKYKSAEVFQTNCRIRPSQQQNPLSVLYGLAGSFENLLFAVYWRSQS